MAKFIIDNAVVFYDGRNISGDLNSISLEYSQDLADSTAFGDGARRRVPGILDVTANHSGWWDSISALDSLDKDLFDEVGALGAKQMSLSGEGGTLGDIAYSFPVLSAQYNQGGSHGEVYPFSLTVNGNDPLVRGVVMEFSTRTATGDGTARQVGAVSSAQTVFSIVHAVGVSGTNPTLDVVIESDATNAFIGAETTRLTHPQFTAQGSDRQSLVATITDEWWRMTFAIGGTDTPTFTIFGVIGIQTTTLP